MDGLGKHKLGVLLFAAGVSIGAACIANVFAQTIPAGYRLFEGGEINGDLNGDGIDDRVLVIRATDKSKFEGGEDLNRRGVMIFFGDSKGGYKLALENRQCLSPEYVGGGVWDKPDVSVSIKKGSLHINYFYGGCGTYQNYNFRYRNSDFELIGFDWNICQGGNNEITSVNFLSKKQMTKVSKKETWSDITVSAPILLRGIANFDEFDVTARIGAKQSPAAAGTLTDARDGKKYRTVKMSSGKTWMAENLNYQTDGSWCYGNDNSKCDKYGRLYNWKTAKSVCPLGWHLPSREEWDGLGQTAGGVKEPFDNDGNISWKGAAEKLKSSNGWSNKGNGTDEYGFSALPGGSRAEDRLGDDTFDDVGERGYWWAAMARESGTAYYRGMYYGIDNVYEDWTGVHYGYSVRCVSD